MEKWILPIMFLALPFALITPGLIWRSQHLFFLIIPLFVVAVSIKNPWVKSFLLYAGGWQIVLFFYFFNDPKGPGAGPGLGIILTLMAAGLIYKLVSESPLSREKWFMVLRTAAIIQISVSLCQFFVFNPVAWFFSHFIKVMSLLPMHLVGSIGNRNYLAAFVAFTIPFFIGWRKSWFLILIAWLLIFCPSPASLAAMFGGAFYFAYTRWGQPKKIILFLLVAAAGASTFTAIYVLSTGYHLWEFEILPTQIKQFFTQGWVKQDLYQGDLGRFGMWFAALSLLVKTVPGMILGYGPGAYWGREYPLHSEYMTMWFYFGLVGLFMLLCYINSTWRFLWRRKDKVLMTSFLIMCIDSVANFPFEIATTGMMGVIILGLIERERLNG